jgi:hypothetical protein
MINLGRNEALAIQIGKQNFEDEVWGWGHEASVELSYGIFSQIPDNSQIFVKWGLCAPGGEFVGRLNKSTLDH